MSMEAWGDGGDGDDKFSPDRVGEIGHALFTTGAQMCREMMARFVEQGGDATTAGSIRANWNQNWGADPGTPTPEDYDKARTSFDMWDWTP